MKTNRTIKSKSDGLEIIIKFNPPPGLTASEQKQVANTIQTAIVRRLLEPREIPFHFFDARDFDLK